jgi:hypothetical protein
VEYEPLHPTADETKRRWQQLERDLAAALEGWLTPGSGSKSIKGDARSYLFVGECKYRWSYHPTEGCVLPLDLQWLEAIWRQAQDAKKIPLLALEWGDGSRACCLPLDYYTVYLGERPDDECETDNRILTLPVRFTQSKTVFTFSKIEVPERTWVLFPWEELFWLRLGELDERKREGKKSTSKWSGSSKPWAKRTFPVRPKGWKR